MVEHGVWDRFRRHRLAIVGVTALIVLTLVFVLGPHLVPFPHTEVDIGRAGQAPSRRHLFGTDDLGRDLLARTLRGGRHSLQVAFITALPATALGLVLGTISGYLGGVVDAAVGFVVNVLLSVPLILVLMVFGRHVGSRVATVAMLIALFSWMRLGRMVRAQTMQLREMAYVQAARAAGAGPGWIITRHLFPNLVGVLLVEITLLAGTAIVAESTLSYLGLGVQPPDTTLGTLIAEAKGAIETQPSRVLIPGTIVTVMILSIHLIGDALRDAFDPQSGLE